MHLLIYCCSGFGKEVMDIARRIQKSHARWDEMVFLDDGYPAPSVYGAEVLRLGAALDRFGRDAVEVVIANGEPFVRKALREKVEAAGVRMAALIDPSATVSDTAKIGAGAIISSGCFVSSEAMLGRNVALIAGAQIGHDAILGDDCVISGQANLGGACTVGAASFIGMGAQIKQGVSVGAAAIVGMGSIVFNNVPDEVIALGNPCRPMRANEKKRVYA